MRLDKTVCYYKDIPVYVCVDPNFPVNQIHIESFSDVVIRKAGNAKNKRKIIDVTDEEFFPQPRRLGYINYSPDLCVYSYRLPERRPRQGLTIQSLGYTKNIGVPSENLFFSTATDKMLKGEYPSLFTCRESLLNSKTTYPKNTLLQMAFDYDFAISVDDVIYFCDKEVGKYEPLSNRIVLQEDLLESSYLQFYLQDKSFANVVCGKI